MLSTTRLTRLALITTGLLLVPAVAMQFTQEVAWTPSDFIVAGVLLFSTGLAYELVRQKASTATYRLAFGVALATALFLIWSNLAVGLIGSENDPANLLYGGVLAVGIIGAVLARLRPAGMARTLLAMAIGQFLIPLIALLIWQPQPTGEALATFGVNVLFVVLWVCSAWLFRCTNTMASTTTTLNSQLT